MCTIDSMQIITGKNIESFHNSVLYFILFVFATYHSWKMLNSTNPMQGTRMCPRKISGENIDPIISTSSS